MTLQEKIKAEIPDAMRAKDTVKLTVVRGLVAAFTNELVAKGRKPTAELSDDEALAVIRRAVKQHLDSIEQFEKGGRAELVAAEQAELHILESYLPKRATREEIRKAAVAVKKKLNITDKAKAGQLTGAVMKELKGNADGTEVKNVVESLFNA